MPKNSIKKIEYGDVFRIGNHLLACADARDAEFISHLVGKRKIKLVCCDCPYGISYTETKAGFAHIKVPKNILNDNIASETEYSRFTAEWLAAIIPHLERKNSVYIFNGDKMLFALREGMERAGVHFSQLLIWLKSNSVIGRKDYLPAHELIAYGWYGTHDFKKSKDKTLIYCPKPSKSPDHPTQKPIPLIRRLILNSTDIGDIVYDGFTGSGTLGIACEQTKRIAVMIELDPEYCTTVIRRMGTLFDLKAERIKL